ncbi:GxxExxY protein [Hymenobacter latericus]|uniref:GxxExxY protein n=1 Tax=Hymenobacter sp. YIM 151858-1 TaxID=2987688 RepID=UPI002227C164|nr:GxxExxY protein [Hymenobacter sp. YIM 151858-1]UYZ60430.1 GxxExxY protein [Hymenobacter sp. YIM 151858-1]
MLSDTRFNPITHRIIGCAMAVHQKLGNGFPENIYQRCLAIELEENGLAFQREVALPIFYKGQEVGARRVDFLIEENVLVELKASKELTQVHFAQTINYLEAYRLEVGLLINFGEASLRFKRFLKNQPRQLPTNS